MTAREKRARRGAYAPLSVHWDEAEKYAELDLECFGAMGCAITWSNRNETDGRVPHRALRSFGRSGVPEHVLEELVRRRIWRRTKTGIVIVGFLKWNPSRAEIEERRAQTRRRVTECRRRARGEAAACAPVTRYMSVTNASSDPGQLHGQDPPVVPLPGDDDGTSLTIVRGRRQRTLAPDGDPRDPRVRAWATKWGIDVEHSDFANWLHWARSRDTMHADWGEAWRARLASAYAPASKVRVRATTALAGQPLDPSAHLPEPEDLFAAAAAGGGGRG